MNAFINMITTGGLYIMFGIWSFVHVLEYKYFTRVEQYSTIIQNMKQCNEKYTELLVTVTHLEGRVTELEDILLLKDKLDEIDELDELDESNKLNLESGLIKNESEKMNVEDSNILSIDTPIKEELVSLETNSIPDLAPAIDEEIVDISEETYPVKNQTDKKGWIKTLLFM